MSKSLEKKKKRGGILEWWETKMKILISPAKKMVEDSDLLEVQGMPRFLDDARYLCGQIRALSFEDAKRLWKCSDHLAALNVRRFAQMDLDARGYLTPALFAYEGLQYQHMAPRVLDAAGLCYLKRHLRILSGFYGILRPFDGVVPYRLEMGAKLALNGKLDLYGYWGSRIYEALREEECRESKEATPFIVNLASREYAEVIRPYLRPGDRFVTALFGSLFDGKLVQKGTFAKMARGEMVRFMAENQVESIEEMRAFCGLGLHFAEALSDETHLVFVRE